jgi:hypothetical protein
VPASIIISILGVENGEVGMASPNPNGTFDYGPMQINTIWLDKIRPYGYTRDDIQYDPCTNVMVGTWILSTNIADSPNLWEGVAGYHSYSPGLNQAYRSKVLGIYKLLSTYLAAENNPNPNSSQNSSTTQVSINQP